MGSTPTLGTFKIRLGRQLADHPGLEPGMLWVRIPPELLRFFLGYYRLALGYRWGSRAQLLVLAEQPGVLVALSRRRSWVQIRLRRLLAVWPNGKAAPC